MAALESRVRERDREGGIPLERPEVTQEESAAYQLALEGPWAKLALHGSLCMQFQGLLYHCFH